jgi:aminocarboxymuconate-semialdehyde decarboxylase
MKIDIHSHFLPRECFNTGGKTVRKFRPLIISDPAGREYMQVDGIQLNPDAAQLYDPVRRIEDMNKARVDMQALSPLPVFYYSADAETALALCQEENDGISAVVKAYPQKFLGLATVPMQDMKKCVVELERAVRKCGLAGVQINTNIDGKNLDEPEFWPFYEAVESLNIPVIIHPHFIAGADRMKKYYLTNLNGNPMDTSIAVASIIFGGIMERFPGLRLIFAHGGGAVPYIRGRIDHGYRVIPACNQAIPKPPSAYFGNIYFDSITHHSQALNYLISTHGIDHVVMGTDYPFSMGDLDPVTSIENIKLPMEDAGKITWSNAAAIFGLRG